MTPRKIAQDVLKGGVDLSTSSLHLEVQGGEQPPLVINMEKAADFRIEGVVPVILNTQPIHDLHAFLSSKE